MGPDGLKAHSEAATRNALMGDAKETQGLCKGTESTRRNSSNSYNRATRMEKQGEKRLVAAGRPSGSAEGVKAEKNHSQSFLAASTVGAQQATSPSPQHPAQAPNWSGHVARRSPIHSAHLIDSTAILL